MGGEAPDCASCTGCTVGEILARWDAGQAWGWQCLVCESYRVAARLHPPSKSGLTKRDLAHEILVRAVQEDCRALRGVAPRTALGAWFCGTGRNVVRERLAERALQPLEGCEPPSVRDDAPHQVSAADDRRALRRLCEELPAKLRTVVTLARHGLSQRQILEAHRGWEPHLSARTLRRRMRRALDVASARMDKPSRRPRRPGQNS